MITALLRLLIVTPFVLLLTALYAACIVVEWLGDVQRAVQSRSASAPSAARLPRQQDSPKEFRHA
jgi:hypothetical protein